MRLNQPAIVLNHLMRYGHISAQVAKEKYGITNLPARIQQLRYLGMDIKNTKAGYSIKPLKYHPNPKVLGGDLFA